MTPSVQSNVSVSQDLFENSTFFRTSPTNFSLNLTSARIPCINSLPRTPAYGTVAYYFGLYVLPIVFAIGILGNVLNLLVLNSKGMRTKTNCFLSAMAATDLCFFVVMVLFNLSAFDDLAQSEAFMKNFVQVKMTLMTFANWFSAASIWIAVAVTVERLIAISRPLHARLYWQTRRIVILLAFIYIFSFYLFLHQWFWMHPASVALCNGNGRRVYGLRTIKRSDSPLMYTYVLASQYLAIACTFVVPVIAMIFLNSLLLYFLRRNRRETLAKLAPGDLVARGSSTTAIIGSDRKAVAKNKGRGGSSKASICARQRTCENKVAFMVSVIILSFIAFLSPSASMYIWETIFIVVLKYQRPDWLSTMAYVSNQLVIINKAMNFVLYCSAGKHFRRKLLQLICNRLSLKRRYYEQNASRSLSKADNYALTGAPGTESASLHHKLPTSNHFKHRSLEPETHSPRFMIATTTPNGQNDGEARFRFWRKSPVGYTRQPSSTPSPCHNEQDQGAKNIGKAAAVADLMTSSGDAKELECLLNEEEK